VHGPWRSAQVKRVYKKNGHDTINLVRSNGQRYDATDADYLVAVSEDKLWFIPMHKVNGYSRVRLSKKYDEYIKYDYRG
jgi:hypothetical protein